MSAVPTLPAVYAAIFAPCMFQTPLYVEPEYAIVATQPNATQDETLMLICERKDLVGRRQALER